MINFYGQCSVHLKFGTTCAWNVIGRAAQPVNVVTMDTEDMEEQSSRRLVMIFTARRMQRPLRGTIHSNNEFEQCILYTVICGQVAGNWLQC